MWPGLPFEPDKLNFYSGLGCSNQGNDPAEELIQDISAFVPPKGIYERVESKGFQFLPATKDDLDKIIEFEQKEFPYWTKNYQKLVDDGELEKLFVVKNVNEEIVGATILFWGDYLFRNLLDGIAGGAGAVGIAKSLRGKGLGIAMQAKVLEILRNNGVKYAVV